jgi:hypothetical protein
MGGWLSVPIHARTSYRLGGGAGIQVQLLGGGRVLSSDVADGDALTVQLVLKRKASAAAEKYLGSKAFVKDLNDVVLSRYADGGLLREYSLPVPGATQDDLRWRVTNRAAVKGRTVAFRVAFRATGTHKAYDACALLAASLAWHVKAGTIPVSSPKEKDIVQVTAVTFRL